MKEYRVSKECSHGLFTEKEVFFVRSTNGEVVEKWTVLEVESAKPEFSGSRNFSIHGKPVPNTSKSIRPLDYVKFLVNSN